MNTLKSLSSCKFLIQYHFIFVCKYRRKILNPIRESVLEEMTNISLKYDFKIHTQEVD
jgi:REP element-mobilizing transposase RayT